MTTSTVKEGFDRRLIAPLILGSVLNPINSSMIAVALVPIGVTFGAPPAETAWLVSALYLATAVGQPVVGRLVDAHGPRPLYLAGTALVGIAGVLAAFAPSLGFLIAARVLLGFGTSAAFPAAMYLIRAESDRTGHDSPNGVLTALSVANQTVVVIGPTLGGLLIGAGGWRTIFTINVPLSAACLVLGALRLPKLAGREAGRRPAVPDAAGMALFAVTLTALLLFLMKPLAAGWYLPAGSVVAAAMLVARELRVPDPFLDLRLLAGNGPLLATYGRQLLTYTVTYSFLYGYTQWLEEGRGLRPSQAGLLLLPMSLCAMVAATLSGRRREFRGRLLTGGCCLVAGCLALLLVAPGSPVWLLVGLALLIGIPQGVNGLANQNALYHQAEPARMGSAAGLLRTCTYLGAMAASTAIAALFPHGASTTGLHRLAAFMLACGGLLVALTLTDRSLRGVGVPATSP